MLFKNKKRTAELEKQLTNAKAQETYLQTLVDTLMGTVQRKHDELTELSKKAYIRNGKGQIVKYLQK